MSIQFDVSHSATENGARVSALIPADILSRVVPDLLIATLVEKLAVKIIEEHSAEIISKIKTQTIANLASIELGKRAAKMVEQK